MIKRIWLKKGKEKAILRRHHWIFSGALFKVAAGIDNGQLCDIYDSRDNFVCRGLYHDASIAFRILSFEQIPIDQAFWNVKLTTARNLRLRCGLINEQNNIYRLFHGEGDLIPGLVVDVYDHTAVIQLHYPGLEPFLNEIKSAILQLDLDIKKIVTRSTYHEMPASEKHAEDVIVARECGIHFKIYPLSGQKTGFFIDQRENRLLLGRYSAQQRVLNLFSYTGGFSLHALMGNADHVTSVDISEKAMHLLDENLSLNHIDTGRHKSVTADVLTYVQSENISLYDIIIVDPPAFAKHKSKRHNAIQAYKRLNLAVLKKAKPGALVFTFSCSQVITKDIFRNTIYAAAVESSRDIKILKELNQAADHPVNIYHPESDYLKGLLLYVN